MNKIYLFATCLLFVAFSSSAQSTEDSVKTVVSKMFVAMKVCDSAMLVDCFAPNAILQTIQTKDGKVSIGNEAVAEFAGFVGKQTKDDLDEQIQFDVVKIDADLAIVWAPYQFYYKGKFSHCGVDSYQLVRINGFWKIQYLIDTRHKDNCK